MKWAVRAVRVCPRCACPAAVCGAFVLATSLSHRGLGAKTGKQVAAVSACPAAVMAVKDPASLVVVCGHGCYHGADSFVLHACMDPKMPP